MARQATVIQSKMVLFREKRGYDREKVLVLTKLNEKPSIYIVRHQFEEVEYYKRFLPLIASRGSTSLRVTVSTSRCIASR